MPHKNGEVKIIKEIAATANTKVSDSNKGKALQQSNKSLLTNGKSTMGEDGHQTKNSKQQQQNQGVKNTSNGHSNNNNLNGKYLKGNGIQLEQQQQIDHDPSVNSIQFEDSNDFSSHVDIPPQLQQNGHSNGEYLDIPNGHLSMSIMPSPPVKTAFPCYDPAIMTKLSDFTLYTNGLRDNNFDESEINRPKKIYRVVLTGGPCGGKTTGQARLCTFFESLGWKVFRVPETATVLLSGGIKFSELTAEQAIQFQEELIKTMMQIERSFFRLAETINRDVLIICDRGAMDASAYIPREVWEGILARNNWNEVDIRDGRYNHIIHMVSAANGAEPFYSTEDHICRSEGLELAQDLDQKAAQAWVGHPYFDVIDNSTDFESKLCRMIQVICKRAGVKVNEGVTSNRHWMLRMMGVNASSGGVENCLRRRNDRLKNNSKKVKFLVKGPLPSDDMFPEYQDFNVVHDYLQTNTPKMQVRLRKRGQKGNWSYAYTVRHPELQGQVVEVRTPLTQRDYNNMLSQKEHNHMTVYKARRCFLLNDQYFQMDSYKDPCHPRCQGLIFLETYTTLPTSELLTRLPKFLNIVGEVTGDPKYSMFNLSLKERWENNKHFCQSLAGSDSEESLEELTTTEHRLVGC